MSFIQKILGNTSSIDEKSLEQNYKDILIENEKLELGFSLIRDSYLFTNKRVILINVQGVSGKKKEFKSIPYKSINRYSIETAGSFDLDAELKLWISSENVPSISFKINKSVDVFKIQKVLSAKILN